MVKYALRLKHIMKKLLQDIRNNVIPLSILFVIWCSLKLLFHRFCPVALYCGFPCPGCGLTKAFTEFILLHPLEALSYNPTYPLWMVLIIAAIWRRYIRGKSIRVLKLPLGIVACVTIAVYIWRMLNDFPGKPPMVFNDKNLLGLINPEYNNLIWRIIK